MSAKIHLFVVSRSGRKQSKKKHKKTLVLTHLHMWNFEFCDINIREGKSINTNKVIVNLLFQYKS